MENAVGWPLDTTVVDDAYAPASMIPRRRQQVGQWGPRLFNALAMTADGGVEYAALKAKRRWSLDCSNLATQPIMLPHDKINKVG